MTRLLPRLYATSIGRSQIPIEVIFYDGSTYHNSSAPPKLKIAYKSRLAQLNTIINQGLGLIESYINQNVEIEGDLKLLVKAYDEAGPPLWKNIQRTHTSNPVTRIRNLWHELRFGNRKVTQGVKNACHHYNRSNDIFWQYLDPSMTYTCAYWKEDTKTIEEAQKNKLEHVCKKLMLQPGEHLIDVGGGWGSLVLHACQNYGVSGTSINPTPEQNCWLANKARECGLEDQIHIQEKDFRQLTGTFDKYVSLGVFEHAGKSQLGAWIRSMAGCLRPGGIGLLHFIAHDRPMDTDFFIRKHIFPGGYLPGLTETVELMAKHGLEILDIENLRRHYALTLDAWAENFEKHWETIQYGNSDRFDERFHRTWKAYLNFCAEYFRTDNSILRLYQITFSKGNTKTYPMSRDFLYRSRN